MTCQITVILFIRCLFSKEIKKQIAGAENIQMLRHAMTLAQEAEIKLKKYEGLNDDVPSLMQVSAILHSEVMAVQGQCDLPRNTQGNNHVQDMKAPRLNWKANLTCYKYGEKGHLAQECPIIQVIQQLFRGSRFQWLILKTLVILVQLYSQLQTPSFPKL